MGITCKNRKLIIFQVYEKHLHLLFFRNLSSQLKILKIGSLELIFINFVPFNLKFLQFYMIFRSKMGDLIFSQYAFNSTNKDINQIWNKKIKLIPKRIHVELVEAPLGGIIIFSQGEVI